MAIKINIKSTATVAEQTFKKICIHGFPGLGKTMLAATAAPFKPIIILTEKTGAESLTPRNIEKVFGKGKKDILYAIPIIEAYNAARLEAALDLVIASNEYNLVMLDSGSKASRIVLKKAKGENKDGRKAYGSHNDTMMDRIEQLIDCDKHVVILAHSARQEDPDSNEVIYYPSFEGQAFNVKFAHDMPHLLCMEMMEDESTGETFRALRCHAGESNKRAKSRGYHLNEIEEPHLGRLISKLMSDAVQTTPELKVKSKKVIKE